MKRTHKKCTKCGEIKPLSAFGKRPERPIGVKSHCKKCDKPIRHERAMSPHGKYMTYKHKAKERNIEWDLSTAEFNSFWKKSCFYCGSKIETIGLDRVNNDKGYNIDNVVSCCHACNWMKRALEKDVFIEHCLKVVKHLDVLPD